MTVAEFVEPWLAGLELQGRKRSTLRGYRTVFAQHVLPALGSTPLQDVRASDLDSIYLDMLRRGRAKSTVHHAHAAVSKLLSDAERKGLVMRNVARFDSAPSLTTARSNAPEISVWSPKELAAFLASIKGNRNETMFRLIAMTGMRRSEVVGLRWRDVDFSRSLVAVTQAVTLVHGEEIVDVPKSRRSRRLIDLDAETNEMLRRHKRRQLESLLKVGLTCDASDRVFTNDIGGPMRPDSVGQAFGRLVAKCELPRIRLHDLRHTHATHLLLAGVNIKVVSERLGHASVSFTLDTYAHVMPGQQAEAAAAVAALL